MDMMTAVIGLVFAMLQIIIGIALAVAAIYIGINFLDKLTPDIEEIDELKKGNVSVGIYIAAVIIAIGLVIQSGVLGLTSALAPDKPMGDVAIGLGVGFVQVIVGMVLAVLAIYIALYLMKKILAGYSIETLVEKATGKEITKEIQLMDELRNDNRAVAIMLAGIFIAVSIVIQAGVSGLSTVLAKAFGL
jgi:uncharacterized membrane protein YjfL (UPF0719 family)